MHGSQYNIANKKGKTMVISVLKRVPLNFQWLLKKVWEEEELPAGDGYQLWETTDKEEDNESSPISPVFTSVEELADWCAENITHVSKEAIRVLWLRALIGAEDSDTGELGECHNPPASVVL